MADPFVVSETRKWLTVVATVQGDQSSASCVLQNGKIVFSARPISKSAKPNLRLLSAILRSDEPLPKVAREWLADMFDPDAVSDYQVKTLARRRRGAKPAGLNNNWDAAQYALLRMDCGDQADDTNARDGRGDTWEVAVELTAKMFRISKTAVGDAVKTYREAKAIHDQIV